MTTITEKIQALKAEAGQHGDTDMVAMCERAEDLELRDSDTSETVDADDLGCTTVEYVETICDSLDSDQPDGHVRLNGRRVYAV